jgi:predicted nucleic acid-binding protein
LWLEIINVAARRWGWSETKLAALARSLTDLGFELEDPDIAAVARWAGRGLTADDAAYLAVAEHAAVPVITDDEEIVRAAPKLATALRALGAP